MAIWFMDGFDHYTTDTYGAGGLGTQTTGVDLSKKWTNPYLVWTEFIISPFYARQQPGQGLVVTQSGRWLYKARPAGSQATLFGGTAFFFASPGSAILGFWDGLTEQCSVKTDASNHVTFNRGATVLATSVNSLTINTWYYIEAKATINNTTGQYEVRVNGTSVGWIPQSGADQNTRSTSNNYATGMTLFGNTGCRWDDLYFGDTTGTNTDFLGPCTIVTLRPCGAGNYTQWTPNYGPNFGNVNEIYPDYDITFNQSSTPNQIDSFTFQDLPVSAGSVFAIQHVLYARQDVGAARTMAAFERQGTNDYPGTTKELTSSYQMLLDPKDADGDDSAWTIAKVNSAEFGYKLIS